MPTWLVHGFRWPRRAIRIHIILQNLDDCAAEWTMAPDTTAELLSNFRKEYPEQMKHLPGLRFIEQYDPDNETVKDQPYAYVCDQVHEIRLGVEVDEVRGVGMQSEAWTALVDLRDKIAPGEKMGWFVVVNGDVERWAPPINDEDSEEYEETINGRESQTQSQISPASQRSSVGKPVDGPAASPKQGGFKKWLGKVRKAKSSKDLRNDPSMRNDAFSPPLPVMPPNAAPRPASGKAPVY
ncbi:hypothetical protein K458DRAFT_380141 [Lentithecium fluviatile CBS 122367]|uniref:Developmental regulator protein n=1 Tax=Lentithecium fluviatile CBS 122367 TaxID=1168545 RepID=A0A6G1IE08_9PLEO|nr:hypothetical protein K458DRAFT_380141 [Lentithecium fluviatile CBS 122367]